MVGRFVDINSLNIEALDSSVPAGVEQDFLARLDQGLSAIINRQVPNRADVRKGVQLRQLAHIIVAGERGTTRTTVGVHDDQKVDVLMSRDPRKQKVGLVGSHAWLINKSRDFIP
jgi:hypothetical protein